MNTNISSPTKTELRYFAVIVGGLGALIFGLLLPWLLNESLPYWPWLLLLFLSSWSFLHPRSLTPVYKFWILLGNALGWINSRIILALIFYVLLLPIGLILRMLGKDPMTRTITPEVTSYRITSELRNKNHIERPF